MPVGIVEVAFIREARTGPGAGRIGRMETVVNNRECMPTHQKWSTLGNEVEITQCHCMGENWPTVPEIQILMLNLAVFISLWIIIIIIFVFYFNITQCRQIKPICVLNPGCDHWLGRVDFKFSVWCDRKIGGQRSMAFLWDTVSLFSNSWHHYWDRERQYLKFSM